MSGETVRKPESAKSVNTTSARRIVLLEEKAMMDVPGLISVRTADFDSLKPARDRVQETPDDLLRSVWDDAAADLARTVRAMGLAPGRADDVLQDVYLTALKKPPNTDDANELRRWLFRVAINRCNLEHRRGARWRFVLDTLTRQWSRARREDCPPDNLDREEEREIVRSALNLLESELRSVLVLRYYRGVQFQGNRQNPERLRFDRPQPTPQGQKTTGQRIETIGPW